MGSLFSSPGKQASSAASAAGQISATDIQNLENYVSGQQQQLRGAIQGLGPNPYFGAAVQVNPSMYAVNPNDTVGFGSHGPGTYTVPASQPTTPPQIAKPQPTNPSPKPGQQPPPPSGNPVPSVPTPVQPPTRQPLPPVVKNPPGDEPIGPVGNPIRPLPPINRY